MKKYLVAAAVVAAFGLGALTVKAQDQAPAAVSAGQAFSQIQPDMQGMVTQPITHSAAGDVLAAYIGHAPRQVYHKQDELIYVISGNGTAAVGYPSYPIGPGSVLSIPRSTSFEITAAGRSPIKAIVIASPQNDPSDKQILDQPAQ